MEQVKEKDIYLFVSQDISWVVCLSGFSRCSRQEMKCTPANSNHFTFFFISVLCYFILYFLVLFFFLKLATWKSGVTSGTLESRKDAKWRRENPWKIAKLALFRLSTRKIPMLNDLYAWREKKVDFKWAQKKILR